MAGGLGVLGSPQDDSGGGDDTTVESLYGMPPVQQQGGMPAMPAQPNMAAQTNATFGVGNPAFSQLINMAMQDQQRIQEGMPTFAQHQQALNDYITAMQTAGKDTRAPWEVMLSGWGRGSNNPADAAQNAAGMFNAIDQWNEAQRADAANRAIIGPKMKYEDILLREKGLGGMTGQGVMTKIVGAELGRNQNIGGRLVDKFTGEIVMDQPAFKEVLSNRAKDYEFARKNLNMSDTDANAYADDNMNKALSSVRAGMANQGVVPKVADQSGGGQTSGSAGIQPSFGMPPPGMKYSNDELAKQLADSNVRLEKEKKWLENAGKYDDAKATQRDIDYNNSQLRVLEKREAGAKSDTQSAAQPVVQKVTPSYDKTATASSGAEQIKEAESRGEARGKRTEAEYEGLRKSATEALKLKGDLNVLEQLYTQYGDNIPEGRLGPLTASIKSGFSSLGFPVKGEGVTDIVNSIGTLGALASKTVEGTNLMPGQMVTYEEKLLQNAFPGLSMTKEGRLMQIQIMKAKTDMNAELFEAARKYYKQHGKLDSGWDDISTDIVKQNPFMNPRRIQALIEYGFRAAKGSE